MYRVYVKGTLNPCLHAWNLWTVRYVPQHCGLRYPAFPKDHNTCGAETSGGRRVKFSAHAIWGFGFIGFGV